MRFTAAALLLATAAAQCPAGYTAQGSKCYKRLSSTGTPAQCIARCRGEQATLPCVANEAENNALVTLAGTNSGSCGFTSQRNCVWIGLRQTVTTGGSAAHWDAWDGPTCHSSYRHWQPGEPNDWGGSGAGSGDENCAFIGFTGTRTWYDGPCSMQAACVCERTSTGGTFPPAPPPPPPPPPPNPLPPSTCEAGWTPGTAWNKCYKALPSLNSAEGCSSDCVGAGGQQLCLGSMAENDFIKATILDTDETTCSYQSQTGCGWLGLYQTVTSAGAGANWDTWRGGCTSSFRNWQSGEPNDWGGGGAGSGDENCAMLGWTGTNTWYDATCSARLRCVCEKPAPGALSPPPPAPDTQGGTGPCPAGWTSGAGKCYKRISTGNQAACHRTCNQAGGELPCVMSQAENAYLSSGITSANCGWRSQAGCIWIGLTQSVTTAGSAANWDTWSGNQCSSTYRHWQPGEPNDYGGGGAGTGDENCAFIGFSGTQTWYDGPCSMSAACMCERPANVPIISPPPLASPPPPPPPHPMPPNTECDPGWLQFTTPAVPASPAGVTPAVPGTPAKTKCYKALDATASAENCGLACKLEGPGSNGNAVCIESEVENDFVVQYVLGPKNDGAERGNCNMQTQTGCGWIGLYQDMTQGGAAANWDTWRGGLCTDNVYTNWRTGEPNDWGRGGAGRGDENCAFLGWNGEAKWSDGPCYMRATCICEKPTGITPSGGGGTPGGTPGGGAPGGTPPGKIDGGDGTANQIASTHRPAVWAAARSFDHLQRPPTRRRRRPRLRLRRQAETEWRWRPVGCHARLHEPDAKTG